MQEALKKSPNYKLASHFQPRIDESLGYVEYLAKLSYIMFLRGSEMYSRICWYPSAGFDFSDLLFYSPNTLNEVNQHRKVDLFVHTDHSVGYRSSQSIPKMNWKDKVVYNQNGTKMEIGLDIPLISTYSFDLDPKIYQIVRSDFLQHKQDLKTYAHLLQIKVSSETLGNYTYPVLYIHSDNNQFFLNCLKENIRITNVFRKNDGIYEGGNRFSSTYLMSLFPIMGVEHLMYDTTQDKDEKRYQQFIEYVKKNDILSDWQWEEFHDTENWFEVKPHPRLALETEQLGMNQLSLVYSKRGNPIQANCSIPEFQNQLWNGRFEIDRKRFKVSY